MGDPSPEETLDALRARAEQDPTNPSLRFDLGERLFRSGKHSEAIQHLQAATRNPRLRQTALDLLGQAFNKQELQEMATVMLEEIQRHIDDPPEDERPPDAEVLAPLKPNSPSSDSAARKFPLEDEEPPNP